VRDDEVGVAAEESWPPRPSADQGRRRVVPAAAGWPARRAVEVEMGGAAGSGDGVRAARRRWRWRWGAAAEEEEMEMGRG
jgi:hypothetical protein